MKFSLSKKIILFILIAAAVITFISTIIQIKNEYSLEKIIFSQNLSLVQKINTKSIAEALWYLNLPQLKTQAKGILEIQGIERAEIWYGHKLILAMGNVAKDRTEIRSMQILYFDGGRQIPIGNYKFYTSDKYIVKKIYNKLITILFYQILKSFVIALIVYILINQIIAFPILNLSIQLDSMSDITTSKTLKIKRKNFYFNFLNQKDELDKLEQSINEIHNKAFQTFSEIQRINNELEELVLKKTAIILEQREIIQQNAKLLSLGDMASGVAHEINNPLAIIKAKTLILKRYISNNKQKKTLIENNFEAINNNINRIINIINSLKSTTNDSALSPRKPILLKEIITNVLNISGENFLQKGVTINVFLLSDFYLIHCRMSEISQVLINLLNNSLDAIENMTNKWITIEVKKEVQNIVVTITDSGSGIANIIKDRIFEPFFSTKEINKRPGLGLSTSMRLTHDNNGSLVYDAYSKNTRFVLKLPTE